MSSDQNDMGPCVELDKLTGDAEYRIKFNTATCRGAGDTRGLGMGHGHSKLTKDTPQAEERAQILACFDEQAEQKRYLHCLRFEHDCEWVHWDDVLEQDRSCKDVLQLESDTLWRFAMSANEDQLPTQSMLKHWGYVQEASCHVCRGEAKGDKAGSLSHILSRCQSSLDQGRYTWRHDSVLLSIYESVREVVDRTVARMKKGISRPKTHVSFINASGAK